MVAVLAHPHPHLEVDLGGYYPGRQAGVRGYVGSYCVAQIWATIGNTERSNLL